MKTRSTKLLPRIMGENTKLCLCIKLTDISSHFSGFKLILWSLEKLLMPLATRLSRLQQVPRKISRAVVSSTNLIVNFQSVSRLLVITLNRIAPSFVCSPREATFPIRQKIPDSYSLPSIGQKCLYPVNQHGINIKLKAS